MAQLEFELVYYDIAVQRFNHYTTRAPSIVVSKFKLQSHYGIHLQTNTLGKGMTTPNPS